MEARNIIPGVYTKIMDLSTYVRQVPSIIGFIPIICERGPDNKLVHTNARDFYKDFGEPNILYAGSNFGQGPYVADSFLSQSDSLYVIRCLPDGSAEGEDAAAWSNVVLHYVDVEELDEPPEYPDAVGRYKVGTGTGDWENQDGMISEWDDEEEEWVFYDPEEYPGKQYKVEALPVENLTNDNSLEKESLNEIEYIDNPIAVFYGIGRGEFYDNFMIEILEHANPYRSHEGVYRLNIYQKQRGVADQQLEVGELSDRFEVIDSFEFSMDANAVDDDGDSMYLEDVVDRYSKYVGVKVFGDEAQKVFKDKINMGDASAAGGNRLENGNSGSLFDSNGDIDTTTATRILSEAYLGSLTKTNGDRLDDVLNTEEHYFNIVMDGGYPDEVKHQIDTLVRNERRDALGIFAYGDYNTPSDEITARDEDLTFNTMYMAGFAPYGKVWDRYTGRDIWMNPVYHMASIIPYTQNVAERWSAPAGFNRASIPGIKELRYRLTQSQRSQFYLKQINPIVFFSGGYTVFSQLTTMKRPSALQNINIVNLILYVKRALKQFTEHYIFENNDEETHSAIREEINAFLEEVQARRGLYSFSVNVYAEEKHKKQGIINVDVELTPMRVAKKIYLNFFIK
ncbi:MAG: phage tail sheath C-terminal domain-containing protein [archaeon]